MVINYGIRLALIMSIFWNCSKNLKDNSSNIQSLNLQLLSIIVRQ